MNKHTGPVGLGRTSVDDYLDRVIYDGRWSQFRPFTNALRSETSDELKREFRRIIAHFGFRGFDYWRANPDTRYCLSGTSDLAERFGKYVGHCSGAMEAVFADFHPALRVKNNKWKVDLYRPTLECVNSQVEARPIHRLPCQSAVDLDNYSSMVVSDNVL